MKETFSQFKGKYLLSASMYFSIEHYNISHHNREEVILIQHN